MNCAAPDTGNMEVLALFGSPLQQEQWLQPLLDAKIRSAFAMTEPDVASSDARNITTRIERDGDEYVITGRKWFTSGAMYKGCAVFILMGKTDPDAAPRQQQSMILVPRDTPGVDVRRGMRVFGFPDDHHGGHAEVMFDNVRVPVENLIGEEGAGFAIAQARLGPGRIHHCMRLIGMAERALELMCRRTLARTTFGSPIAEHGVVQDWIAESRVKIEQLRVLVLKTAWLMDTVGNRGAHTEIQAIKIATPKTVEWILDKAIQAHGAAGRQPGHAARRAVGVGPQPAAGRRPRRGAQAVARSSRARQVPREVVTRTALDRRSGDGRCRLPRRPRVGTAVRAHRGRAPRGADRPHRRDARAHPRDGSRHGPVRLRDPGRVRRAGADGGRAGAADHGAGLDDPGPAVDGRHEQRDRGQRAPGRRHRHPSRRRGSRGSRAARSWPRSA